MLRIMRSAEITQRNEPLNEPGGAERSGLLENPFDGGSDTQHFRVFGDGHVVVFDGGRWTNACNSRNHRQLMISRPLAMKMNTIMIDGEKTSLNCI